MADFCGRCIEDKDPADLHPWGRSRVCSKCLAELREAWARHEDRPGVDVDAERAADEAEAQLSCSRSVRVVPMSQVPPGVTSAAFRLITVTPGRDLVTDFLLGDVRRDFASRRGRGDG